MMSSVSPNWRGDSASSWQTRTWLEFSMTSSALARLQPRQPGCASSECCCPSGVQMHQHSPAPLCAASRDSPWAAWELGQGRGAKGLESLRAVVLCFAIRRVQV